jgi:hypothetical protein
MVMVFITGLMGASSKVTGKKTKLPATAFTIGRTAASTRATGNKIICTDKDYTSGPTAANTKVTTWTTRKMDMAFTLIQMEDATRVSGKMESNMAKGCSLVQRGFSAKENGSKAKECIGWTRFIPSTPTDLAPLLPQGSSIDQFLIINLR